MLSSAMYTYSNWFSECNRDCEWLIQCQETWQQTFAPKVAGPLSCTVKAGPRTALEANWMDQWMQVILLQSILIKWSVTHGIFEIQIIIIIYSTHAPEDQTTELEMLPKSEAWRSCIKAPGSPQQPQMELLNYWMRRQNQILVVYFFSVAMALPQKMVAVEIRDLSWKIQLRCTLTKRFKTDTKLFLSW